MSGDPQYCYPPNFKVLRNKLDIVDADQLDLAERRVTAARMRNGMPSGRFDLAHLKAIHHHLFQDIYEWAGQVRLVEIAKGGTQFMPRRFIETGMADIHGRIIRLKFLTNLDVDAFAREAGAIIGDINHVHPFREGNGRTQLVYLALLAAQAGHALELTRIDRAAWMEASRQSHLGRYQAMTDCIRAAL